jgi:hypothetical protein
MVKVKVVAVSGDRVLEVKAIALCSDNLQERIHVFWGLELRQILEPSLRKRMQN